MVFGTLKPDPYIVDKQHFATAPIVIFYNVNSPIFEFPHFVIHSDKMGKLKPYMIVKDSKLW